MVTLDTDDGPWFTDSLSDPILTADASDFTPVHLDSFSCEEAGGVSLLSQERMTQATPLTETRDSPTPTDNNFNFILGNAAIETMDTEDVPDLLPRLDENNDDADVPALLFRDDNDDDNDEDLDVADNVLGSSQNDYDDVPALLTRDESSDRSDNGETLFSPYSGDPIIDFFQPCDNEDSTSDQNDLTPSTSISSPTLRRSQRSRTVPLKLRDNDRYNAYAYHIATSSVSPTSKFLPDATAIVTEIVPPVPGDPGSDPSPFIPEPFDMRDVDKMPQRYAAPWTKSFIKEFCTLVNMPSFAFETPAPEDPVT
jgi:hypothetical protein